MQRSYSKPDVLGPVIVQEHRNCDTGVLTYSVNQQTYTKKAYGELIRSEIKNFHKRRAAGEVLPPQSYLRWDYTLDRDVASTNVRCCAVGAKLSSVTGILMAARPRLILSGNWVAPSTIPGPWDGVNSDALMISAMADILPDLDALTTAIEARKTIEMVVKARHDAKDLIQEALRGGKHTVKAAANAWMAWRYGWEQLGRDVQNCYDFLKVPYTHLVVTGQSGRSTTGSSSESILFYQDAYRKINETTEFSWDHSVRARVVAKWQARTLNAIADPAISLWETIPYSFVADWFVNVGDCLAAWKVRNNISSVYPSYGVKSTLKCTNSWVQTPNCTGGSGSASASCQEVHTTRTRSPASLPSLIPSFDVNITSKRAIDAAAMLAKRIL